MDYQEIVDKIKTAAIKRFEASDKANARVLDPNTGEELPWDTTRPRNGQWDMGHTPDNKYSDWHKKYTDGKISLDEFKKWYQDPSHYRPESPSANRSHKFE